MSIAHIFIDESGTPALDLNKGNENRYIIYVGVVIEEKELLRARNIHKHIIDNYCGGRIIKSHKIKNDKRGHFRRMKILSELKGLNHYVVALVVDKSRIYGAGLSYRQSFIKFFNNLISKQFVEKYSEYHIHFDKLGYKEFQNDLVEYMNEKGHGPNLFANNSYDIKDDESEEPLIQIADLYAGCVHQYYTEVIDRAHTEAVHNYIKSNLFIEWFPEESINYFGAVAFPKNDFDPNISKIALSTAKRYLENEQDEIGIEITKIILQEAYLNPYRHISSREIKRKMGAKGINIGDPISEIAKLRDKGVFIVSPQGKKGYKFPCNEREIAEFFDRLLSNIVPQLKRAHILHRILIEQSFSYYNILANERFKLLRSLIDVVKDNRTN